MDKSPPIEFASWATCSGLVLKLEKFVVQTYPFDYIVSIEDTSWIRPLRSQTICDTDDDDAQLHTKQLTKELFCVKSTHAHLPLCA